MCLSQVVGSSFSLPALLFYFFSNAYLFIECIINSKPNLAGCNISQGVDEAERTSEGFYIRSGITVVLKNAIIADGLVI
jgi:hypothetical protein